MRKAVIAVLAVLALGLVAVPALASHPEVSLVGSDFEIDTDANLVQNDPSPSEDWATIPNTNLPGTERRATDKQTGAGDDSFGQGAKEDTAVPTVVSGQIPNNKSDLKNFGGYLETTPTGAQFLNLFWTRVQEPTGTTNMDFEFNKGTTLSSNGVTPVRTAGDILIQYDLASGGTHPELFLSRWITSGSGSQCQASNSTPCWGKRVNLTAAGDGTGSINTSPISAADSDGLGALGARTFGEAQIDFTAFAGGEDECITVGSAYLKSRSSDSFTAALKDFIAPLTLNFTNCGSVHVIKTDDADNLLDGATFDLITDADPFNNATGPGGEDTNVVASCTTDAGVCDFTDVLEGEYWVVETAAPPGGYDIADPVYQHVTITADEQVEVTFVNPRQLGAIQLTKTEKNASTEGGSRPQADVDFTIDGQAVTTDANGQACVEGLALGSSYDVVETVPDGYVADGDTTKSVLVDNAGDCDEGFETVEFSNTPLTDVTVSVDSQVEGGTASTISCDTDPVTEGATDAVTGDGEVTAADLAPGTLVCTIIIDP